ncbi:MAG: hypothetical protein VB062_04600 [Christensenella sp.]|nr:hypothetical protein [Christensenella sp.]
MAKVNFDGIDDYVQMLAKFGDKQDEALRKMVNSGARVVYQKVKSANTVFSKYVKLKLGKKNQYGWFAQVQFKGKTSSGAAAGRALTVYEHGRAAGTKNGRSYPAQPARPWIDAACASVEPEAVKAMEEVYDEEVAKLGND